MFIVRVYMDCTVQPFIVRVHMDCTVQPFIRPSASRRKRNKMGQLGMLKNMAFSWRLCCNTDRCLEGETVGKSTSKAYVLIYGDSVCKTHNAEIKVQY
jgi:hypothetical protein